MNAILAEVIQGGLVLETNISEIVKQCESPRFFKGDNRTPTLMRSLSAAQTTAKARKASASAASRTGGIASFAGPGLLAGGGGGTTGTGFDVGINAATAAAGWARNWISKR